MRASCLFAMLLLAACGSSEPPAIDQPAGHVKIGKPYKIKGSWYYPEYEPDYVETGIASWYGDQFHGRPTANGETFHKLAMTAAHTTMPLPSYAEVTNLENGRTLTVRVNDRGPFIDDRLIDLSQGAAKELGFEKNGLAKVRVAFLGFAPAETGDFPDPPASYARADKVVPKAQPVAIASASQPVPVKAAAAKPVPVTVAATHARPSATDSTQVTQVASIAPAQQQCRRETDHIVVGYYEQVADAEAMVRFLNDSPWSRLPRHAALDMQDSTAAVLVGPVADGQQNRLILAQLDQLGIDSQGMKRLSQAC